MAATVLPPMASKASPYSSSSQPHPNLLQPPYPPSSLPNPEFRRHSSSESYHSPPSLIRDYADGDTAGGRGTEGGGLYGPPGLRGRLPSSSSSSSHQLPLSRSPSPSALSPQLTFEPHEPQHYHGQTSFGYDFLPAVQPQIFSATSAHPFTFASSSSSAPTSSSDILQPSHSPQQHPYLPTTSSSSVQQYTLAHSSNNQLGSSSRRSAEESDERRRRGRMSAQQEEDGFRRGEMLAERRNVMEQERGLTRNDGWEGRKEDRRGGMDEVDWNGSGAEDEDDDEERDGSGLGRRDSGTGSRGEIKTRRRTSRAQFQALETMFQKTSKPTQTDRKNLGEQLDMSPRAVQVWFQNRRAKAKKQRQKAAFDGADPLPPPPPPQPPLAFSENPYPGAPPNSRIHHSVTYDSVPPTRRASASAGPSRRSHSDDDRMGSSSSHSFSPEAISPSIPPQNNGALMGGWETVPSIHRSGSANVNGPMPPPSFPPPPQNGQQHPSSNGNGSSQHLGRPSDRRNSTSPVYDDRSPQPNWNPGGGQFGGGGGGGPGPGFLQSSPRRGSGIPGAGESRMGRRSSTTPADGGGGVGPDRTVKRRDSNGALVSDPLSFGGRRGSIPQNIHPHQQHHSSSPSRQPARTMVPSNGSSMEVSISHSFRGGGGQGGNRHPGSTVAQYLASSSASRRSSLPSPMSPNPQGGQTRSPGGMYAPPVGHAGAGGSRRELSPIQDDGAYASQNFGLMGPGGIGGGGVEQGMFDPVYGNSSPYSAPLGGGGIDQNLPRRQPHPFYGNGPIPDPSFEPQQPPAQPQSRNNTYHHLHQQHQPYDEIDPLTIHPPAPPLPQLSQYAFPGPPNPNSGLSSAPPQSTLLSRRNSGQTQPQQPLFTSSPHESCAFPPAPIGTLPDSAFSFGTYQQGEGGGEYGESDPEGTTNGRDGGMGMGMGMGMPRNGSTGGDSDGSWASGFGGGGGGGGFGAGQDGTGHYPSGGGGGGENGGFMPHGFHPDVRRSSAPADLLQNFSSLQVLGVANGLPPSAFSRPSPLNPAFVGLPNNGAGGGGGTSPSRNPVQPLYAIHESSHSGSGSGQGGGGRRGSGQGAQMPEGFVQQPQQQQVDWTTNQSLQGMDPNYPYPNSSYHQSYSSSSGGTNTTASQSRPSTGNNNNQPQSQSQSQSQSQPLQHLPNDNLSGFNVNINVFDPSNSSQRHLNNPNLVFELEGPGGYGEEEGTKNGGGFGFAYR